MTKKEKESAKPSSEISVSMDEIEALAREVDAINQKNPDPQRKRKKDPKEKPPIEGTYIPPTRPPDPEFVFMLQSGTSAGIDWLKEAFRLMEPGMNTREKLGFCVARLANRLAPVESDTWIADVSVIAGYLAFWWLIGRLPPEEKKDARTGPRPLTDGYHG